jgi:two-component system NtrC family response regulator
MMSAGTATTAVFDPGVLVGEAPGFLAFKSRLAAVARAQRTTTIVGPTGSGKELVARLLHAQSGRACRPYVTVHCAALPENLFEAELFGHCRGAFTGATQDRQGLIRSALQGTLFLDEVDSLTPGAQAKLLRFLETGEYRAVGNDRVEHSDAWVIAATNQDLHDCVRQGAFRPDLLYRLEVVHVDVPSLASRGEDVLLLADHFLQEMSPGRSFNPAARRAMLAYGWPGNVRELKHRVESAALFTDGPIEPAALGLELHGLTAVVPVSPLPLEAPGENDALEKALWTLIEKGGYDMNGAIGFCERLLIQAALRAKGNNRTRAAERLGIHVRTIYKKLSG